MNQTRLGHAKNQIAYFKTLILYFENSLRADQQSDVIQNIYQELLNLKVT